MQYLNLAFYKFARLTGLPGLRARVREKCLELELKGTVLLAEEGINCFVAGRGDAISSFKAFVETVPGLESLPYKESHSETQPFTRMLVKVKPEIITMGVPSIRPARATGARISPRELKRWLDERRDFLLLDTRNDYEVRLGRFDGAVDLDLQTFRQFPSKSAALPEAVRAKPVVTYCTGGIRCEKASAWLAARGFTEVYQLDGGILKYFEEAGGDHFAGECFVFDYRVAVDACLRETGAVLCYRCQNPVTEAEQRSAEYVPERSCPHCVRGKPAHKERIAAELKAHG